MVRPKAKELTERELDVMRQFWQHGERTIADIRDFMESAGDNLAYTTVATLVKILVEKRFLKQTNDQRPFLFEPTRSFEEVSGNILTDLVNRLFGGSREQLIIQLMGKKKLTKREKAVLSEILNEEK